jgi:S1-C subfamily serine protease
MKKTFLSLLCALALMTGLLPSAAALEGESLRAADTLAALGLIQRAETPADYRLDDPAPRAQAAMLLVRLAGDEAAAKASHVVRYRDADPWSAPYVAWAAREGWITGVSDLAFYPNRTVTANAWCAMLLRMLGYSDRNGAFAVEDAAAFAQRIGLLSRSLSGPLTRGEVFETMAEVLSFSHPEGGTVLEHLVSAGVCSRSAANALGLLDRTMTAREIADRCSAAVFRLDLYKTQKEIREEAPAANATGFFISADGLAVTNYHSIEKGIQARAVLSTGEAYPMEAVLYYDAAIDIAVVRISRTSTAGRTTSAFARLELAGAGDVRPGDTVYALGNPLGQGLSVSAGVVSATDRKVEDYALPCIMNTADISRGSSGGALLNAYGQVVAVTTGAFTYGNSMYLAVPVDPAMKADLTAHSWALEEVTRMESVKGDR